MSKTSFTKEERIAFYNAIAQLDIKKDFVNADKEVDSLSYTTKIKSYEKITGRPTDEELTRALILLRLISTYKYDHKKIEIENRFGIGGRNDTDARAVETDICIKNDKDEIEIIIEIKRIQDYDGVDDSSIRKQLFTPFENITKYNKAKYLFHLSVDIPLNNESFPLQCIGIDTNIAKTYEKWEKDGRVPHMLDIVSSGDKPLLKETFVKLDIDKKNVDKKFKDLDENFNISIIKRKWRTLWDYIWGGALEDNKKFENFNKVLLAKIYDERKTKLGASYSFQRKFTANNLQSDEALAVDIDLLYKKAFREYLS